MSLLSELRWRARRALRKAEARYESAGSMERHRLAAVIRERKRAVELLEQVTAGLKFGQITQQDAMPRRKRCQG